VEITTPVTSSAMKKEVGSSGVCWAQTSVAPSLSI